MGIIPDVTSNIISDYLLVLNEVMTYSRHQSAIEEETRLVSEFRTSWIPVGTLTAIAVTRQAVPAASGFSPA
jgi:hypothetical protein